LIGWKQISTTPDPPFHINSLLSVSVWEVVSDVKPGSTFKSLLYDLEFNSSDFLHLFGTITIAVSSYLYPHVARLAGALVVVDMVTACLLEVKVSLSQIILNLTLS